MDQQISKGEEAVYCSNVQLLMNLKQHQEGAWQSSRAMDQQISKGEEAVCCSNVQLFMNLKQHRRCGTEQPSNGSADQQRRGSGLLL
ncbi:hypothetical protein K8S19_01510 [bacterium]|nr:hypothetical protein [bacterium]